MNNKSKKANKVLVCGSIAYDFIMEFPGYFKEHILADEISKLSVSFYSPKMRKEFGGCAGNIAYNLKLLGIDGTIIAAAGSDFLAYERHLDDLKISRDGILIVENDYSAQGFLTTDLANNQITTFHPGAMTNAHKNLALLKMDLSDVLFAIISPDSRDAMLFNLEQCIKNKIPFIFDPGQALPILSDVDIDRFIDSASAVIMNAYEASLVQDKLDISLYELIKRIDYLIITRGEDGSDIYKNGDYIHQKALPVSSIKDPTGCGDAYRAGIIYGLIHNLEIKKAAEVSAFIASKKIASYGNQNHTLTVEEKNIYHI